MRLSGADIIVKTLIEQGCDTVFGYPGGQILNVYDSLYTHQNEINHAYSRRMSRGAAHAADGYARATGKVGVVISTSGPGATNLVTGIATACLDSVPIVAICGNVPTTQIGTDSFQEIDITGVTLPITKHNYFVGRVEELADTIREAFALAASGRPGPVLIDVPKDVQIACCDYEPQPPAKPEPPKAAKEIRIKEAANYINAARRPYIYFGGGMITAGAQEEMLRLADMIDAPIGCSLMGISGIPTDHPRFLGMQGMHGHYASSMAMHHADLIISLGVRFNDRVTGNRHKFATGAKIVHIDVDGSELSKTVNAVCGLRGDVKPTLDALLPLITAGEKPEWRAEVDGFRAGEDEYLDHRAGMTPRNAILTLNRHLGENTRRLYPTSVSIRCGLRRTSRSAHLADSYRAAVSGLWASASERLSVRLSERENAAFSLPETAASVCVCRSLLPPLPTMFRLSFLFSITECSEWYVSGRRSFFQQALLEYRT